MLYPLKYQGVVPASKSLMNRALIVKTFFPQLSLLGQSQCDDVTKMIESVKNFGTDSIYDCGAAGTVLRFLAFRVSREPGLHILRGTPRLLSRPQKDLIEMLSHLGVRVDSYSDHLRILSQGWKYNENGISVNRSKSSQFASGLLLSSWNLPMDLKIQLDAGGVSEGYWEMTVELVKDLGMKLVEKENLIIVPKNSQPNTAEYRVESDLSSAFALAALAALNGQAKFENYPFKSLQPDQVFVDILKKMQVSVQEDQKLNLLSIQQTKNLHGVEVDLLNSPDLFPVLGTLCAFANSASTLKGAPHLVYKESDRLKKTAELVEYLGCKYELMSDGMKIFPNENSGWKRLQSNPTTLTYDTDHDHRLAFAAALIRSVGFPIRILHPEVVNKSFPEFWEAIQQTDVYTSK